MRPLLLLASVGFVLSIGSPIAYSHGEPRDNRTKAGIGWLVRGSYYNFHAAAHGQQQTYMAEVTAAVANAGGFRIGPAGPNPVYSLKVVASLSTPLTGLFRAEGAVARVGNQRGYRGFARAEKIKTAHPTDSEGQWYLAFGVSSTGGETWVGHKECGGTVNSVGVSPPDSATVINTSGTPDVTYDAQGEVDDIVRDQNGDIVWIAPPTLLVRLTSRVTEAGGLHTYTYTLENFGEDPCDFVIPEITTPSFPGGWSGAVAASSYAETSFQDGDAVYSQHATLSITHTDEEVSSEQITTGVVYTPRHRLAFDGTNTITAAYFDPVTQTNVVRFTVSDDAALAILFHVDGLGEDGVDEVEGITEGLSYELEDDGFLPGNNDYRVRTGSGVNGWEQEGVVTIVNS
jgi:hypothetical protein